MSMRDLECMGRAEIAAIWDRLGPRMREVLITFARRLDYEFEARPRPVATQEEIDAQREAWTRENLRDTVPGGAAQRESWARGEAAMGSDADEARERAAARKCSSGHDAYVTDEAGRDVCRSCDSFALEHPRTPPDCAKPRP